MAGWDASAGLLGVVRYSVAGDVEGALGALVRASLNPGAGCVGLGGITERATAAVSAIADRP